MRCLRNARSVIAQSKAIGLFSLPIPVEYDSIVPDAEERLIGMFSSAMHF